jgi:hypothetical protein
MSSIGQLTTLLLFTRIENATPSILSETARHRPNGSPPHGAKRGLVVAGLNAGQVPQLQEGFPSIHSVLPVQPLQGHEVPGEHV